MHTLDLRQGERPAVMEITQLNELCAQSALLQMPSLNQYFNWIQIQQLAEDPYLGRHF